MTNSKRVNEELKAMQVVKSKKELSAYSIAFLFLAFMVVFSFTLMAIFN